MKKTLLALAVAGATVATGANANELYNKDGNSLTMGGRAEARLSLKDGKADDQSRVRLNFLGKMMVTDSLYGVGFYEGEFTTADNSNAGSELDNRYTYAGIGGNFGEVTYGKNDGALGVITDFTDIMAYHGNNAADKIDVADRTDNMLSYKGQFSDLGIKASYRFADRAVDTTNDKYTDNGEDGYSLSAIYAFGDSGFKLGGGYADQGDANEFMVAASYAISDFYFAGTYTDAELNGNVNIGAANNVTVENADYTGFEFAAAYNLGQARFTTTYNNAEIEDFTAVDYIAVDATYFFKPNFRTYISYNFNMLDKDDVELVALTEDEIRLGLRYDF